MLSDKALVTHDTTLVKSAPDIVTITKNPMLFSTEAIYKARKRVLRDLDQGRITEEQACRQALELDPGDHIALQWRGQLLLDSGDVAGAAQYFWQAVETNPWAWTAYMGLAQVIPAETSLFGGVFELACRELLLDEEAIASEEAAPLLKSIQSLGDVEDLGRREQLEIFAEELLEQRADEPPEVIAHLEPYRLVQLLHGAQGMDAELVDEFVEAGSLIVPLLVGTIRGWARSWAPDDMEHVVENSLALLGEIGDPVVIPYLLDCLTAEDTVICAAASWALDRLVDRHPREAAAVIAGLIPGLDAAGRIAIATRLLIHPAVDADGQLLASLGENLGQIHKEDFDPFFPLLVSSMILARGRAGVGQARGLLERKAHVLPGTIRRKCERHIAAMEKDVDSLTTPPVEPSPWTVYDICAGEAIWDDEEEDDGISEEELLEEIGDEDGLYVPEPVQRADTPGRNDPCWCGSGKKYKKCHLDSDQRGEPEPARANRGADSAGKAGAKLDVDYARKEFAPASQFDPLRKRLGRFLTEAVSQEDSARAVQEFIGHDAHHQDTSDTMALVDWIIHDWIPPTLGRRVMPEFLRRHGASLSTREREMVESWARSSGGLYEVQEGRAGSGIGLKDLLTNELLFAHDVSMSKSLVCGDGLLSRVIDGDRGREMTGVGITVPREQLEAMRQWMEDDHRASGLEWTEYLKRHWPRIRRQPAVLYAQWRDDIQLINNDGEEILFSKSVYRVLDGEALIDALQDCSTISEDRSGEHYSWLSGSRVHDGATVLGSLDIQGPELILECNSKERCERGKKLLAQIANTALRHLRDQHTTQKEMKRRAAEGSPKTRDP